MIKLGLARSIHAFGLCVLSLTLAACDIDWQQPTMRYTGRLKPYEEADFFEGSISARPVVADTVPRTANPGWAHALDSREYRTGKGIDGQLVANIPVPVTPELMRRGRERYNVYCIACHGAVGYGDGIVTQRGFPIPPSYHQDRLRNVRAGHFFDAITNGFGRMYRYGDRIPTSDRWAIVAYIRALQRSQNVKAADLSADQRAKLKDAESNSDAPHSLSLDVTDGPVKERR